MARLADGAVAVVFLAAGLLKIWDPGDFALSIARLRVLPHALIAPAAILLPWMEVAAAAALLARGPWRAAGKGVVAGLLLAFTAVVAVAWIRGETSFCGCFGFERGFFSRLDVALVRNVLLLALLGLSQREQAHAGAHQAQAAQPQ